MDKQKIEEMKKHIKNSLTGVLEIEIDKLAEELLKHYQPKIPEGAVVLTGTETEERLEDLLIDFDEMSFYPATTCPNPDEYAREWKRNLIYVIGRLKKEIAEKFAERLKASLDISVNGYSTSEIISEIEDKIDEIAKDFTGGKACRRNERKLI